MAKHMTGDNVNVLYFEIYNYNSVCKIRKLRRLKHFSCCFKTIYYIKGALLLKDKKRLHVKISCINIPQTNPEIKENRSVFSFPKHKKQESQLKYTLVFHPVFD